MQTKTGLWQTALAEHIGGREEQQDRVIILNSADNYAHLLVVADGMGGHQGGALAAQTVIEMAYTLWQEHQTGQAISDPWRFLENLFLQSHHEINELGKRKGLSPHSTCAVLLIQGKQSWWGHIGDSRVYYFREGQMLQRSRDHSLAQMLVEMGRLREEDMARHQSQGCLLRGLGGQEICEADYGQASTQCGDLFVLCSDGFWEYVASEEMRAVLAGSKNLGEAAVHLVKQAAQRGGAMGDNICLAVAYRQI